MEKTILTQLRPGDPLPARILGKPDLILGLNLYYDAFVNLTSSRQLGFNGSGPIPYQAMRDYCVDFGIDGEQRQCFFYLLQKMDEAYLARQAEKAKNTSGK